MLLIARLQMSGTEPEHTTRHWCKYLELHAGRHHNGPEGERVWADGRDHDGWNVGVDHGGSCCHSIRCTSRGRGHDHAWLGQGDKVHTVNGGNTRTGRKLFHYNTNTRKDYYCSWLLTSAYRLVLHCFLESSLQFNHFHIRNQTSPWLICKFVIKVTQRLSSPAPCFKMFCWLFTCKDQMLLTWCRWQFWLVINISQRFFKVKVFIFVKSFPVYPLLCCVLNECSLTHLLDRNLCTKSSSVLGADVRRRGRNYTLPHVWAAGRISISVLNKGDALLPHHLPALWWWGVHRGRGPHWRDKRKVPCRPPPRSVPETHTHTGNTHSYLTLSPSLTCCHRVHFCVRCYPAYDGTFSAMCCVSNHRAHAEKSGLIWSWDTPQNWDDERTADWSALRLLSGINVRVHHVWSDLGTLWPKKGCN